MFTHHRKHDMSRNHIATDREIADNIARRLGDAIGNREAVILADPDVRVRRDSGYPGCWVCSTPNKPFASFIYRTADNTIVG